MGIKGNGMDSHGSSKGKWTNTPNKTTTNVCMTIRIPGIFSEKKSLSGWAAELTCWNFLRSLSRYFVLSLWVFLFLLVSLLLPLVSCQTEIFNDLHRIVWFFSHDHRPDTNRSVHEPRRTIIIVRCNDFTLIVYSYVWQVSTEPWHEVFSTTWFFHCCFFSGVGRNFMPSRMGHWDRWTVNGEVEIINETSNIRPKSDSSSI